MLIGQSLLVKSQGVINKKQRMIGVTSTSDMSVPLRTEGRAGQRPLSYLLPWVMGVRCVPGRVIELFCFQRNSTFLKTFPKLAVWSMSSGWMCYMTGQSCQGKFPLLSYARKFRHGIGNLAARKIKDSGFWPQRKETCSVFSLEKHNVIKDTLTNIFFFQ